METIVFYNNAHANAKKAYIWLLFDFGHAQNSIWMAVFHSSTVLSISAFTISNLFYAILIDHNSVNLSHVFFS